MRDALGLICRWMLLGLAGLAVAGVAVTVLDHAASQRRGDTRMLVPDRLRSSGATRGYFGYLSDDRLTSRTVAMCLRDDGRQNLILQYKQRLSVRFTEQDANDQRLTIRGTPYGPLAFQETSARVQRIPSETPLILVDARLVNGQAALTPPLRRQLAEVGTVAFLCAQNKAQAFELAARCRQGFPTVPFLYDVRGTESVWETASRAIRALQVEGLTDLRLITADESLAEQMARSPQNVEVHGLGPGPASREHVAHYHASWRDLVAALQAARGV